VLNKLKKRGEINLGEQKALTEDRLKSLLEMRF